MGTVRSTTKPKLLDRVREAIRTGHYSRRTEKVYVHWIRRFIRHPMEMGAAEVSAFLTALAVRDRVEVHAEPSPQRTALSLS
jgi:hypothetical protein